jgi:lysophospholipase L1-like esterase
MKSAGPPRSRLFGIAAVVLAVVVSIVFGELLVRILGAHQTWTEKNQGSYVSPYKQSFSQPWILVRQPSRILSYKQPEFDYQIRTNSEGLRDVDHPINKPQNEFRIVVLGDSWVEGQGAPFEKAWPKVLEEQLNKISRQHVHIIIGGVAGSDPVFGLELFRRRLLKYKPDMVIQAVNDSDVTDIIARGGKDRFRSDGILKDRSSPWFEPLWERVRLFRVIMMDAFGYDWMLLSRDQQAVKIRESLEEIQKVGETMNELSKKEGFKYIMLGLPQRNHFLYGESYKIQPLESMLLPKGVDYVDLRPVILARIGIDENNVWDYFWKRDGHANEKGYGVFAREVERLISPRLTEGTH